MNLVSDASSPQRIDRSPRSALRQREAAAVQLRVWLRRSRLDRSILNGVDPSSTPELCRRARQLTASSTRERLANTIERVIDAADEPPRSRGAAVPLNRDGIRLSQTLLQGLAADLRDAASVSPRGVVLTEQLLGDGASPLYASNDRLALEAAVRRARATLHLG